MGTVPSPYVPVAGDDATQARVLTWADAANYLLGNTTSGGSRRPLAILRQSVAQSLTTAVEAAVTFNLEDADYDNGHSTVTNTSQYVAQTAGEHWVAFAAAFVVNAVGIRYAYLRVNGTTAVIGSTVTANPVAGFATSLLGGRLVSLAAGDFVELMVFQNSGGALNTSNTTFAESIMTVEWRSV